MMNNTDLPQQPDTLQQPPRSFNSLKLLTLITAILLSAIVAGTVGYLLGIRRNQSMTQNTQTQYQQIGWVSPTISYNPVPTAQPTETFVIKSQSFSPDRKSKIMIEAYEKVVYGTPQQILIADASGAHETVALRKDFLGDNFADLTSANWSPNSKYVYVYTGFIEGGDLYIFKATGEAFSNGKKYLLASELGYPPRPLTPTWITDTQIQMLAYQQGPIATNKTYIYIFDVEKGSVTLKN